MGVETIETGRKRIDRGTVINPHMRMAGFGNRLSIGTPAGLRRQAIGVFATMHNVPRSSATRQLREFDAAIHGVAEATEPDPGPEASPVDALDLTAEQHRSAAGVATEVARYTGRQLVKVAVGD